MLLRHYLLLDIFCQRLIIYAFFFYFDYASLDAAFH